jgi:predicted  nucleic acid-binding Zn-ribbon protein
MHLLRQIKELLTALVEKITAQNERLDSMAGILDALKTRVAANTSVIESAKTLISGIGQQLKDAIAANDPAALQALADTLTAEDQSLADVIAANTPAAPATPTPPVTNPPAAQ